MHSNPARGSDHRELARMARKVASNQGLTRVT
jgi:hypothetical protein